MSDTMKLFTEPQYMWMPGNIYNSLLLDKPVRRMEYHSPTPEEWTVVGVFAIAILAICYFFIVRPVRMQGG